MKKLILLSIFLISSTLNASEWPNLTIYDTNHLTIYCEVKNDTCTLHAGIDFLTLSDELIREVGLNLDDLVREYSKALDMPVGVEIYDKST